MENTARRRERTKKITSILRKQYPDIRLALDFTTPLELLIALILAAQCTDERVNRVTPGLFQKYKRAKDWAELDRTVLEEEIHSTGFFRQKASSILKCTAEIESRFGGIVPSSVEDLLTLPGVGRKTANILRGNAFGTPAIGVDTHVARLAFRLIEEQPFSAELARDISSQLGLAEVVPVRRRLGRVEPLASGYLSIQALARAEGWVLVPADCEGYMAGARVVVRPWP